MEKERERAQKMNYPSPIHEDKIAVDKDFDAAMMYIV
jgi:proline dehydrogenase